MDNENLNQELLENPSANLKDYETEIQDKKNFLSALIDKFKNRKEQKLLNSGEHNRPTITKQSIYSLWEMGNLRASLIQKLNNISKVILGRSTQKSPKNTLSIEIIGDTSKNQNEKNSNKEISEKSNTIKSENTISNVILTPKTVKKTAQIEIAKIDTSAIKEDKKIEYSSSNKNTSKQSNIRETQEPEL